jgi:uncharacterized membrane protein
MMDQQMKQNIEDKRFAMSLGKLLRFGVLASLFIVLIGASLYLYQHGSEMPAYRKFLGEPKRLSGFDLVWQSAWQGRGRSIIQLGLFILIATPVARIVFSVIGYIREKDYLYVIITLIVLGVILFSL